MVFIQELTAYFHKTQRKLNLKLLIIIYHLTEQISFCVYGCKYSNYRQKPKKSGGKMDKTTNNVNVSTLDILYAKYRKEMYQGARLFKKDPTMKPTSFGTMILLDKAEDGSNQVFYTVFGSVKDILNSLIYSVIFVLKNQLPDNTTVQKIMLNKHAENFINSALDKLLLNKDSTSENTVTVCEPDDLFFHIKHNCTDDTLDSRARIILLSEKPNDSDSVTTIIQPFGIVRNIVDSLILTIIDMLDKDFKHEDIEDCQELISMGLSCFVVFANDEFYGGNPSENFELELQ